MNLDTNKLAYFSELLTDKKDLEYEKWFDDIAYTLMNHLCLEVGKTRYRITECEIYYYDAEHHPDPYIHFGMEQLTIGNLFLNKAGGLDITFGNCKKRIYGGLLIRGINIIGTKRYINKITKITSKIFRTLGSIISTENSIKLKDLILVESEISNPIKTKRARLKVRGDDRKNYIAKQYRYIIELKPSHKFYDKENVVRELKNNNSKVDDVAILGYKLPIL